MQYQYIRKSIRWEGKRYEVRGKTEREVCEKLMQLVERLEQETRSMTVDQWFRRWLETYKESSGITRKSLKTYEEKYRCYIGPVLGDRPLEWVRDMELQEILNTQAGKSYSHVSKLRMVMQEMFRQARRSRLIFYDPAEGLTLPEYTRNSHRELTESERRAILAAAREHPAGLWVLTGLYAGLRPGESAALLWKDVDFKRNEIHVSKAVESGTNRIRPPKTPAGVRDVPMRRELRERMWAERGQLDSLVFPSRGGEVRTSLVTHRQWADFLKTVKARSGLAVGEGLTPYCLRHTFCTDLQRAGVPINVAKELMGHANISVTANIYTHRDRDVLHDNMAKLEK